MIFSWNKPTDSGSKKFTVKVAGQDNIIFTEGNSVQFKSFDHYAVYQDILERLVVAGELNLIKREFDSSLNDAFGYLVPVTVAWATSAVTEEPAPKVEEPSEHKFKDLPDLTMAELKELADIKGIKYNYSIKKSDLIALLQE